MQAGSGFLPLKQSTAGWHCTIFKISSGDNCGATLEQTPPVRPQSGSDWIPANGLSLGWTALSATDCSGKNKRFSSAVEHSSTTRIFLCWTKNWAAACSVSQVLVCFFLFMILSKIGWWYPSSGGKGSFFYRNIFYRKFVLPLPCAFGCGTYPQLWTGMGYAVSVELEDFFLIRICKEIKTSTETQFHPICVKNKFTSGNTPQEICFSWLLHHTSEIQPVLCSGLCKHSSLIN